MIVKCQRSLETTSDGPRMLFYNRARDWECFYPLTPEWNQHFGPTTSPEDNKFFAEVRWNNAAPPTFVRKLPEQHW